MNSLRLRLARRVGRMLPPLASPTLVHRIYPFALGRKDRLQCPTRAITGSTITCLSDEVHSHHFLMLGYYDWRLVAVAQTVCKPGDVIVELGANVGTETIAFADIVGTRGRVLAFEPFPDNVAKLRASIGIACGRRLQLFQTAVADQEGEATFMAPEVEQLTGTGHLAAGSERTGRAIPVRVTTLDTFSQLQPARLLAMDVEGAELAVLRGGKQWIKQHRPVIVLEASALLTERMGASLGDLARELIDLGYRLRKIGRFGLTQPDTGSDADACNWVAVSAHEENLLSRISRRLLLCGSLPPLRFVNSLVMKPREARAQ